MTAGEPMSYLDLAKAVLGTPPATKAIYATEGVLEDVWRDGGWLLIAGTRVRAVRVPPELRAWVAGHESEVLQALHRRRSASFPIGLGCCPEDATCRPGADEGA
jgi:hypothetical protein